MQKLWDAGHDAYIVGGSVRDFLLGRPVKDHDIATSANPDELCRLFPDAVTVGKQFGVLKVPVRVEGAPEFVEIATFREDLEYVNHRHPTGVLFAGPVEDARRRDFTINALFFDLKTSRILDTVGGMEDLQRRVIRAIGIPAERFKEDALRLMRAVRFATRLGFALEEETAKSIVERARLIQKVSGERIRDELTLMITSDAASHSLQMLSDLGLMLFVLPEIDALRGVPQSPLYVQDGDIWKHTLKVMNALVKQNTTRTATLAWGTLLRDIGKPGAARRSGGKNFNGHELDGAKMAVEVCERMKMARIECERISWMVENSGKFREVFQMREATLQRFLRQPGFEELLALHRAEAVASDGNLAFYEFCASRLEEIRKLPPEHEIKLVTGEDLIQLGLKPGPRFSEIIRVIEDLALERKLTSKEAALEYVVKHFVG